MARMNAVFFALLVTGCSASTAQREACYAKDEAHAAERVARECQGIAWEDCPARPEILEELQTNHARCP